MKHPLFVTVGTTALTNAGIGSKNGRPNSAIREHLARFLGDPEKPARGYGPHRRLAEDLIEAHVQAWRKPELLRNRKRYRTTSAELLSTYLGATASDFPLDGIVLLCSDTPTGKFAAEINREVMLTLEYRRALRPEMDFLEVQVGVIPGLDAKAANFSSAVREVVTGWAPAVEKVRINITGGYKSLAATLGIVAAQDERYRLYYLHESLDVLVYLNPRAGTGGDTAPGGDF